MDGNAVEEEEPLFTGDFCKSSLKREQNKLMGFWYDVCAAEWLSLLHH